MMNSEPSLRAAEVVGASALVSYLLRKGWTAMPSRAMGYSILSKDVEGAAEPLTLVVPVTDGCEEERRRVADALRALEIVERRPASVIAADVRQSSRTRRRSEAVQ